MPVLATVRRPGHERDSSPDPQAAGRPGPRGRSRRPRLVESPRLRSRQTSRRDPCQGTIVAPVAANGNSRRSNVQGAAAKRGQPHPHTIAADARAARSGGASGSSKPGLVPKTTVLRRQQGRAPRRDPMSASSAAIAGGVAWDAATTASAVVMKPRISLAPWRALPLNASLIPMKARFRRETPHVARTTCADQRGEATLEWPRWP